MNSITFAAYNSDDLENLMRGRLEDPSLVDPKALSYIAKKFANAKGDARPALEVLTTALKKAKERAKTQGAEEKDEMQAGKSDAYVVKIKDVFQLGADFTKLTDLIRDLPLYQKLMVCAAVRLAVQRKASEVSVTGAELNRAFKDVYFEAFADYPDFDDINSQIAALNDIGLAKYDSYNDTISFDYMPEELDTVVRSSLGKEGNFFNF